MEATSPTAAIIKAHVVANVIGDNGWVPRVVLRDPELHLAHEVRADVRRLRVDAATGLGEQGERARSEAEPERDLGRVHLGPPQGGPAQIVDEADPK